MIKTYEGFFDRFKKKPKPVQIQGEYWFISSNSPNYMKLAFIKISEVLAKQVSYQLDSINKLEQLFQILLNDHVNNSSLTSFYLALDYYTKHWTYSAGSYPFEKLYKYNGEIIVDDFELDAEKYNL
jgi:hypothetical protein